MDSDGLYCCRRHIFGPHLSREHSMWNPRWLKDLHVFLAFICHFGSLLVLFSSSTFSRSSISRPLSPLVPSSPASRGAVARSNPLAQGYPTLYYLCCCRFLRSGGPPRPSLGKQPPSWAQEEEDTLKYWLNRCWLLTCLQKHSKDKSFVARSIKKIF